MTNPIRFVGPTHALQLFGVKLVGINAENGKKFLFTIVLIVALLLISRLLRRLTKAAAGRDSRRAFWVRQGVHLTTAVIVVIAVVSIWFDDPARLTTAIGLVTAGLAFALQRVITALAGYLLILRGRTFNVGDRIVMGGVRGDVIALGFLQTTIMEMGQPPVVQNADPAMWVRSRQYTGRIVSVSNAMVFDEPVFNYTRDFPYIWEEMSIPISYKDDRQAAERVLLEAATRNTIDITKLARTAVESLKERYAVAESEMGPRVYWRITDNWIEMTIRFLVEDHGVRDVKDRMAREIMVGLDKVGVGIASGTYEIVGVPTLRVERIARPVKDTSARQS